MKIRSYQEIQEFLKIRNNLENQEVRNAHVVPGGNYFMYYNFGKPFLAVYCCLSDLFLGVEKKISTEIMHFYFITDMAAPITGTPAPQIMKFTI